MMRRRLNVALAAVAAVLAFSCASPKDPNDLSQMKSLYKGEVGESPVGVIPDAVLHDAQRNRDVTTTIEYPTRNAGNPLIVFSPGFGGSNDAYEGLSSYWASQGFVVIRVSPADAGRKLAENQDFWDTQTESDRRNRVRDLTFVLDSLDQIEKNYPELQGKIDRTKIAFAGHSYGAYTALLAGGMKTFPGGTSSADPRVKAIVAMSPQGPNEARGLTRESFAGINVPTLFMTGSRDMGPVESETPEWRSQAFELAAPGDKWLIVVEGARHATFIGRYDSFIEAAARERPVNTTPSGRPTGNPLDPNDPANQTRTNDRPRANDLALRQRDLFGNIKSLSLAFFDAYLKNDAKGREALQKAPNVRTK
jgi:predicted dienelactone hydrolase